MQHVELPSDIPHGFVTYREVILMGKQSIRENKTIYQIFRETAGLTRSEASEKMAAVSDSKIEKFEYELQDPTPYDIVKWQML